MSRSTKVVEKKAIIKQQKDFESEQSLQACQAQQEESEPAADDSRVELLDGWQQSDQLPPLSTRKSDIKELD